MATPLEISVQKLEGLLQSGETLTMVDVREGWERDICAIDGSVHIPLNQLPQRVEEIPTEHMVVMVCHHGGRSAQAMMFLRQKGLSNITNLEGGVDAWARQIDPEMKVY